MAISFNVGLAISLIIMEAVVVTVSACVTVVPGYSSKEMIVKTSLCWERANDWQFATISASKFFWVTDDNASDKKATLIKVDSANKRGSLLEVLQALTDLNLIIRRAYISSDGEWFMDDEYGNKVYEDNISERIHKSLGPRGLSFRSLERSVVIEFGVEHTSIELSGRDRPGLLSEVFAVLTDLKCNVVGAEVWTHNSRMASVIYITDETNGAPIDDPDRLANIKQLLLYVIKSSS